MKKMAKSFIFFLILVIIVIFFVSCKHKRIDISQLPSAFDDASQSSESDGDSLGDEDDDEDNDEDNGEDTKASNDVKDPVIGDISTEQLNDIIYKFKENPGDASLKGLYKDLTFELCEDGTGYKVVRIDSSSPLK